MIAAYDRDRPSDCDVRPRWLRSDVRPEAARGRSGRNFSAQRNGHISPSSTEGRRTVMRTARAFRSAGGRAGGRHPIGRRLSREVQWDGRGEKGWSVIVEVGEDGGFSIRLSLSLI